MKLLSWFKDKTSVLVAFSGGVDSSLVAKAAFDVLKDNATAAIAISEILPPGELENAIKIAEEIGIELIAFEHKLPEEFYKNTTKRCYYCKKTMMQNILEIAEEIRAKTVVDGTNADDLRSYRPGIKALRELGIRSPLAELGITKPEVRRLAKRLGLSNYNKASESCLATKIPYGMRITKRRLEAFKKLSNVNDKS